MIIHKLNASFGKLQNESLKLHEGLNVINSPNESGKSTWCAFIRAMLYGIDSSERARGGYLPEKQRYAPWSGAPMEGSMDLTANYCDISITRTTRAKNAPMREFSAVYTGSNTRVEELNSQNAGEQLTGISRDVFNRSAFIAQGEVAVKGSPELEKRISTIVSTGEDKSSYSEADERLRSWQRKRRFNKRGLLPELEERIDEGEHKLQEMNGALDEMELLDARLQKARQDCVDLELAVTESRKKQRRESLSRLSSGRGELKARSDEHDAAMEALSISREKLRASRFGDRSRQAFEDEVDMDMNTYDSLSSGGRGSIILLPALICFVLAIVFAALYASHRSIVFIIVAAISCIAAVVLLLRYAKIRQAAEAASVQRRQILKKYKVTDEEEIYAVLQEHSALWTAVEKAQKAEMETRLAYELAHEQQAELESEALDELDFSGGSSEAAKYSRELSRARAEAEQISAQLASLSGRLSAMGDPLVLSSELSCMKDEHKLIEDEYSAISLAQQLLSEADDEMQSRFSPEIGKLAAKYMSSVTGGRYEDVLINSDFSARTKTGDDTIARESEYLSAGTLDLMYIAVRLAVCELALPKGEPCPLIIDDALVNLDDQRYEQALELLKQIAKTRQVILFTCRD